MALAPQKMEEIRMKNRLVLGFLHVLLYGFFGLLTGCSAKFMKAENPDVLKESDEFIRSVNIVVPGEDSSAEPIVKSTDVTSIGKKEKKTQRTAPKKVVKKTKKGLKADEPPGPLIHEPADVEDGVGFVGRRPKVDPFWIGETVVHDVHYFKVSAGALTMKVDKMAQVNGRKAYQFVTSIESYPTFSSMVYAADDTARTLVDYEDLVPRVFSLHVKESAQLREGRSIFDFEKKRAKYWEKKISDKSGIEEKNQDWEILPFSQNVFSAIFYMRLFAWETGKEYAFRVADAEQNLIFKGTALRRETLETEIGPYPSVVVKTEIMTKGVFTPVGDILIWLSDDDRKFVLRIESKIKIGTLITEIVKLEPGIHP